MSFVMQCPFCATQIKVSEEAEQARCFKCKRNFTFGDSKQDAAAESSEDEASEADDDAAETASILLPWLSPWGVAAFAIAALALFVPALSSLAPSVGGLWYVTLGLGILGVAVTLVGVAATGENRETKDTLWLTLAGMVSGAVIVLALVFPAVLSPRWALEFSVPVADPNLLAVVPRDKPREQGKPLSPDGWADAATEAIREGDVLILLESVQRAPISERDKEPQLLVHLRVGSTGHARTIKFVGFDSDKRRPSLSDDAGHSYAFIEQREREPGKGPPWSWLARPPRTVEVPPSRALEFLLVFEATPAKFVPLKLELPASAWGRQGSARLRIAGYIDQKIYEALPPAKDKEEPK